MSTILVYFTVPNQEEAISISKHLVESRLAACTNTFEKIISTFDWVGVKSESEIAVIVKTTLKRWLDVKREIKRKHSYETPAILAWPILDGDDDFLNWIEEKTIEA